MKVLIQNGYSTKNSGDGLLVDLTAELVTEALGDCEMILVANDPDSFENYQTIPCKSASRKLSERIIYSLRNIYKLINYKITGKFHIPEYSKNIDDCCLVISVGGGYMRGKSCIETFKVSINNLTQLIFAAESNKPTIYLSQSVGPFFFKSMEHSFLKSAGRINRYYVRDDRSKELMDAVENVKRTPDLAVLKLCNSFEQLKFDKISGNKTYLVVRHITTTEKKYTNYISNIKALFDSVDSIEIVIQSEGRGNNDRSFAEKVFGLRNLRTLKEALDDEKGLVISVRLHGSLETMLNGCPSIHLSYERKGFGAYEDLGLQDYLFNALDFDIDKVLEKVNEINENSNLYYEKLKDSTQYLKKYRDEMVEEIKAIAGS